MDQGLKDLIDELREYGNARKGELAGMVLEAANRLEEMGKAFSEVGERLEIIDERLESIVQLIEDYEP